MTRKIIVSMWTTLDGFVAGPDDEMDWLHIDDQVMRYERELVESADSLLLGRLTHADFAGYWPKAANDPDEPEGVRRYGSRVDAMEKIVISASGDTTPWRNTQRLEHPEEIKEIKLAPGGDIVVYGSLGVVHSLAELGLIDEFHLLAHPIFLNEGKPLFGAGRPVRLDLISAEPLRSGVALNKYRPTP